MENPKYRLCAIDLDETLLNSEHEISARNLRAVNAIRELGVKVVVASGRMHESALPYVRQLGLETPIISYNGAMVKEVESGAVWMQQQIPSEYANIVMDFCRERKLQLNYYLNDKLHTESYTNWLKLYHGRTKAPLEINPNFYEDLRDKPPIKLIIVDTPEYTSSLVSYFREIFGEEIYVTKSTDEYLEFMPKRANKGSALALVAERFGISAEETIAFGDSYNDIPMLEWAGLSVAVANAKADVRAMAKKITSSNDEEGVGKALEEIFG